MTVALSPAPPPLPAPHVDAALAAVRAGGLRVSAARRLLVEALFAAPGPVSAAELAEGRGGLPPSDLASVYRNLADLDQLEAVVRRFKDDPRPGEDQLAIDAPGPSGPESSIDRSREIAAPSSNRRRGHVPQP